MRFNYLIANILLENKNVLQLGYFHSCDRQVFTFCWTVYVGQKQDGFVLCGCYLTQCLREVCDRQMIKDRSCKSKQKRQQQYKFTWRTRRSWTLWWFLLRMLLTISLGRPSSTRKKTLIPTMSRSVFMSHFFDCAFEAVRQWWRSDPHGANYSARPSQ